MPNTSYDYELPVINSTGGAQHFDLHPAGIALHSRFLVVFFCYVLSLLSSCTVIWAKLSEINKMMMTITVNRACSLSFRWATQLPSS